MNIRITDILNKYETNIDIDKIHPDLKKNILVNEIKKIELEDISIPQITHRNYKSKNIEEYNYKLKNISLRIKWYVNEYDSISIFIKEPTPPEVRHPYLSFLINYKGEDMSID